MPENTEPANVSTGLCKVCGQGPTVRSHLFPRAFAHDMRAGEPKLLVGSLDRVGQSFSQSGVVDRQLLCEEHERVLAPLDDYGVRFVREFEQRRQMIGKDTFIIADLDSERLVRFVLSVLWRFGASRRPEAKSVSLGPYEVQLQRIIFGGADCSFEPLVSMWALRSKKVGNIAQLCTPPSPVRGPHFRYWSFILCGLAFVVKTDQRVVPPNLEIAHVNGRVELVGLYRLFEDTDTWEAVTRIVANMNAWPPGRSSRPSATHDSTGSEKL